MVKPASLFFTKCTVDTNDQIVILAMGLKQSLDGASKKLD